jgi:hypothetical protein
VSRPGFEPATYRSRSRHANHSATASHYRSKQLYTNLSASCHFQWLKSELASFRYTGVTEHDRPQQARKRAIGLYNTKTTHYTVYQLTESRRKWCGPWMFCRNWAQQQFFASNEVFPSFIDIGLSPSSYNESYETCIAVTPKSNFTYCEPTLQPS